MQPITQVPSTAQLGSSTEQLLVTRRKLCSDLSCDRTQTNAWSHLPLQHSEVHCQQLAGTLLSPPLNTLQHQSLPSALCQSQYFCPCTMAKSEHFYLSLSSQDAALSCGLLPHQPRGFSLLFSTAHVPWAALVIGGFLHSS